MGIGSILSRVGLVELEESDLKKEAEPAKAPVKAPPKSAPQSIAPPPIGVSIQHSPVVQSGDDSQAYDLILSAIAEGTKGEYGILSLKSSVESLEGIIVDVPTRYKAIYSPMKANGTISLDVLEASAQKALKIIETEEAEFNAFIENSKNSNVQSKLAEAEAINAKMQEHGAEIAKLTETITELSHKKLSLENEANTELAKIEGKRITFNSAKNRAVTMVTTIITNVRTYLS